MKWPTELGKDNFVDEPFHGCVEHGKKIITDALQTYTYGTLAYELMKYHCEPSQFCTKSIHNNRA